MRQPHVIDQHLQSFNQFNELTVEQKDILVCKVLLYLFRGISSSQLTVDLKNILGPLIAVKDFRQSLLGDGYLLRNVKGYLYALASRSAFVSRKDAKPVALEFDLQAKDIILGKYLYECENLRELLIGYSSDGYKCLTLRRFSRALESIARDTHDYTSKFVHKKLRFIYQSNGMEASDFTHDFIAKGLQSVMAMYPCVDGQLHAVNIAKQAIHNHGINTILKYTSKGRQTLVRDKDGCFSSKKISFDLLQSATRLSSDSSYFASNLNGDIELVSDIHSEQELEISVKQIMRCASPKKRKALSLFMGEYCPNFTSWLKQERNIHMDNVDYYNRLLGRNAMHLFFNNTFDFLQVDREKGYQFVEDLKLQLS